MFLFKNNRHIYGTIVRYLCLTPQPEQLQILLQHEKLYIDLEESTSPNQTRLKFM